MTAGDEHPSDTTASRHDTVAGVFDSMASGEAAVTLLLDAGVPRSRITMSQPVTADGIAAEAPGESFENQPGEPGGRDTERARFDEGVRSGVCVVSVDAAADSDAIERLLRRAGARNTTRHLV